jgi:polyisoprenoid-binding protein YceI
VRAAALRLLAAGLLACGPAAHAAAVEYAALDAAASRITFNFRQMGVNLDGSFARFSATFAFDPARPDAARATLELPLASIDTGFEEGNEEIQGKAWFNTAAHPTARFESTAVRPLGGNRYELSGRLTIKGRTRPVVAALTFSPQGNTAAFDGGFTLRRSEFAIGEGEWADTSIVADEVRIRFHLVAAVR